MNSLNQQLWRLEIQIISEVFKINYQTEQLRTHTQRKHQSWWTQSQHCSWCFLGIPKVFINNKEPNNKPTDQSRSRFLGLESSITKVQNTFCSNHGLYRHSLSLKIVRYPCTDTVPQYCLPPAIYRASRQEGSPKTEAGTMEYLRKLTLDGGVLNSTQDSPKQLLKLGRTKQ